MSKPMTNLSIKPLGFEHRLVLVQREVRTRVAACPKARQNHLRAQYWVNWITKNILEVAHVID